jgi:hypothetical protein
MSSQPSRRTFLSWLIAPFIGSSAASLKAEASATAAVSRPIETVTTGYAYDVDDGPVIEMLYPCRNGGRFSGR